MIRQPLRERLLSRVEREECWLWTGKVNRDGYGLLTGHSFGHLAHRLAYLEFVGPLARDETVHHRCVNRRCIKPEHLFKTPTAIPVRERLLSRIDQDCVGQGCWMWTGTLNHHGYGQIWLAGHGMKQAHRIAYEILVGAIPAGLVIDHLCRVRRCINPEHLEVVTVAENSRRGCNDFQQRKTHCPQGHPYDAANTINFRNGWRRCRSCQREAERAHDAKRRGRRRSVVMNDPSVR